jgi:hypothetical protein
MHTITGTLHCCFYGLTWRIGCCAVKRRVANADFENIFTWLVAAKYAVYHSGDACASSARHDAMRPLGNIFHISPGHADVHHISG